MRAVLKLVIILMIATGGCNGIMKVANEIGKVAMGLQKTLVKLQRPSCDKTTCIGAEYCFDELGCFDIDPKIWCIGREFNYCPLYNKSSPSTFDLYTRNNSKIFEWQDIKRDEASIKETNYN